MFRDCPLCDGQLKYVEHQPNKYGGRLMFHAMNTHGIDRDLCIVCGVPMQTPAMWKTVHQHLEIHGEEAVNAALVLAYLGSIQ